MSPYQMKQEKEMIRKQPVAKTLHIILILHSITAQNTQSVSVTNSDMLYKSCKSLMVSG